MSTILYGILTRKREESRPRQSSDAEPPGVNMFTDALAALVPAEVLALHGFILPVATRASDVEAEALLRWIFWVLVALSVAFYWTGRQRKALEWLDALRMLIPPAAFALWAMLQAPSTFDPVASAWSAEARYVTALIGAAVLGLMARSLAVQADARPPPDG